MLKELMPDSETYKQKDKAEAREALRRELLLKQTPPKALFGIGGLAGLAGVSLFVLVILALIQLGNSLYSQVVDLTGMGWGWWLGLIGVTALYGGLGGTGAVLRQRFTGWEIPGLGVEIHWDMLPFAGVGLLLSLILSFRLAVPGPEATETVSPLIPLFSALALTVVFLLIVYNLWASCFFWLLNRLSPVDVSGVMEQEVKATRSRNRSDYWG